jgi:hypothetical protein
LLVVAKPAMYAARAAATGGLLVRSPGAHLDARAGRRRRTVIREAADAIAVSWLRIDSTSVSRTTASANDASTTSTGEPGKYTSPSAYPLTSPENR